MPDIYIGQNTLESMSIGNNEVEKIYIGNVLVYEETPQPSGLLAPTISLYDSSTALKIESANDEEDQYEIYVDDVLVGTYNKFYDFEASSNTLTKCLGKQYYTGEIVTPQTVNNTSITTLPADLFGDTVASKITISEGITSINTNLFNTNTTTVNVSFPSTIDNLVCLNTYPQATVNIGLQNYIEYAWDTALSTPTGNNVFSTTSTHTAINYYVKSTITTLNNYSLYITINATKTVNLYFDQSSNAVMTIGSNLLYVGTSKIKPTYNVYTDNASIKDAMLTYAGSYCTVNVYKRDGGAWE